MNHIPRKRTWPRMRRLRAEWRDKAITALGGVCKRCGFSDRRALQFDHVKGDGRSDRQRGITFFKNIINDKTERFQLLCANCNSIKAWECGEFGYSMHDRKEQNRKELDSTLATTTNSLRQDNITIPAENCDVTIGENLT